MNGRPLALVKEDSRLMRFWKPGLRGLKAVMQFRCVVWRLQPVRQAADVLPASVGQIPVYYSHLNTGRPYNATSRTNTLRVILMKLTGRFIRRLWSELYHFHRL